MPLDHYSKDKNNKGFKHPLLSLLRDEGAGQILPIREYDMMEFMNRVTDKVAWEVKVFKDEIIEEWKKEIFQARTGEGHRDFSEKMFEWVSLFLSTFLILLCIWYVATLGGRLSKASDLF